MNSEIRYRLFHLFGSCTEEMEEIFSCLGEISDVSDEEITFLLVNCYYF